MAELLRHRMRARTDAAMTEKAWTADGRETAAA
jgi:hypothetical protein